MGELTKWLIGKMPLLGFVPELLVSVVLQFVVAFVVLLIFVAPFAGITSYVERRIAGRMMSRIGPNRVGPQGFFQWIADGIKCFLKEDVIPKAADPSLFRFAPYLVFVGMFAAFVTIPFTSKVIVSNLNIGVFYLLAVTSLVTVGIIMSGWSSNNKWSLLGGMRSAAQIVSYEIPTGVGVLVIVLLTGSLSLQDIIVAQGAYPWQWFLFHNPFATITFFIVFLSSLAEGNRTPFDLPEAETELVSGYNTEYSGMRFVFFFFAEWANLYLIAAIATTLFLGGWQIPAALETWAAAQHVALVHLLQFATFFIKALILVFIVIWIRWTLPRVRVDQLMEMCWKYFVPIGFVCLIGTALWMLWFPEGSLFINYTLFLGAFAVVLYFFYRVGYQLWYTRSPVHLNPFM